MVLRRTRLATWLFLSAIALMSPEADAVGRQSQAGGSRDEFFCPPNQVAAELQSVDGFLELQCMPFPARCEGFQGPPVCLPAWRNRCPMRHYVSAIQRRFAGRESKLFYKVQCCSHPAINDPEQYVNQFTRSFGPEQLFDARALNVGSGLVQYLANIVGTSKRDHQTVVIGQLRCQRRTTTTPRTTTPRRLTTPTSAPEQKERLQPTPRRLESSRKGPPADPLNRPPPAAGAVMPACFPPEATALTPDGLRPLHSLRMGDRVATDSHRPGEEAFSPIIGFIHREPEMRAVYLELRTGSGDSITLTPNHLIPAFRCPRGDSVEAVSEVLLQRAIVPAAEVRLGDCLLASEGQLSPVVEVEKRLETGAFAPVTEAGTIVIGGVRASCYSDLPSQYLQHGLFQSWAAAAKLLPSWLFELFLPSPLSDAETHAPSPILHLLHELVRLCAPT